MSLFAVSDSLIDRDFVKKLYEFVTNTIGKPMSKGWKGIKFKFDDSDSEDENKNVLDL